MVSTGEMLGKRSKLDFACVIVVILLATQFRFLKPIFPTALLLTEEHYPNILSKHRLLVEFRQMLRNTHAQK